MRISIARDIANPAFADSALNMSKSLATRQRTTHHLERQRQDGDLLGDSNPPDRYRYKSGSGGCVQTVTTVPAEQVDEDIQQTSVAACYCTCMAVYWRPACPFWRTDLNSDNETYSYCEQSLGWHCEMRCSMTIPGNATCYLLSTQISPMPMTN